MHKSWRFTPILGTLAVSFGVLAVLGLGSGAWAGKGKTVVNPVPGPDVTYVLESSSGTWGPAQTEAVQRWGTVGFSHAASGIGTAVSNNPDFTTIMMNSGAFSKVGEDMQVQWVDPNEKVSSEGIEADVVTPGNETFINEQWNIVAVNAAAAWGAGYTGAGVRVAVLDGGINNNHIDLNGHVDVAH